jgi:drug/metabolite transporter (DMT)-like permease
MFSPPCYFASLAAIGLFVMSARGLLSGDGSFLGDGLTVLSAVAYALHILFVERFSPRVGASAATAAQIAVVAVLGALTVPFEDARFHLTPALVWTLLFTGICASALFLFAQMWAQARTSAVRAALIFSLEPLFSAVFAWFIIALGVRMSLTARTTPRAAAATVAILILLNGGYLIVGFPLVALRSTIILSGCSPFILGVSLLS